MIGILLVIVSIAFAMIWLVYDAFQRTVMPVQSMTSDLATRVSPLFNPTPTLKVNPITIIRDVRSLARLETIQYTIEKVITAEQGQGTFGVLFGDKLIFVGYGKVYAGVDLNKLGADDIEIKEGILTIRLPEAEIFEATLDNEKSYVYNRETGLLTKGDINLESAARRLAEDEIEKAAIEDGILKLARQNAESYLSRLLSSLGYPEVIFVTDPSTPQP